ncbi:hypothetical protein HNV11_01165 [Spirosoma taeanense]|uniref:Anti-sigma factor n=1 Tax=Spirosoma taeanense TaxID=2735870 RepID=A0A6M5Y3X3_9BACT|nr:hypothetical protein [Spirosoma taeanense]QJW88080.1 hypothetical protein HNV11_01165 [Spirosoma taeanense]
MKTHQYLTSGILESYLLGIVSDKEKEEVERVLATDADVLAELNELETEMEQFFLRNAVPPPPGVRANILERLGETGLKKQASNPYSHFAREPEPPKPNYVDVEVSDTHIRVHKYWRPAFIAVFVLSKIFLVLGLYYYFKSNSLEQEITRLKAATEQTASQPKNRTE